MMQWEGVACKHRPITTRSFHNKNINLFEMYPIKLFPGWFKNGVVNHPREVWWAQGIHLAFSLKGSLCKSYPMAYSLSLSRAWLLSKVFQCCIFDKYTLEFYFVIKAFLRLIVSCFTIEIQDMIWSSIILFRSYWVNPATYNEATIPYQPHGRPMKTYAIRPELSQLLPSAGDTVVRSHMLLTSLQYLASKCSGWIKIGLAAKQRLPDSISQTRSDPNNTITKAVANEMHNWINIGALAGEFVKLQTEAPKS